MPAFGKSGTLRMCCLRSMVAVSSGAVLSLNREVAVCAAELLGHRVDGLDTGAWRTLAQQPFDTSDRFLVSLRQRFDTSIRQIAYPPGDPLAHGDILREPAKAHTLDPSADDEPPCNTHVRERVDYTGAFWKYARYGAIMPRSPVGPWLGTISVGLSASNLSRL